MKYSGRNGLSSYVQYKTVFNYERDHNEYITIIDKVPEEHKIKKKAINRSYNEELSNARLLLIDAVRQVIHNCLGLLGIEVVEAM